jgi:hypothetical protein
MTAHLIRISLGALAMLCCALVAGAVVSFLPFFEGQNGRDFQIPGTIMAGLMCVASTVLRGWLRWPVADLLASLISAEAIALGVISVFSGLVGSRLFDPANLRWLGTVSFFIVFPWLAGVLIGSLLRMKLIR